MPETIQQALAQARTELNNDSAQLDSEILLSHVLKQSRSLLHARPEQMISDADYLQYQDLIQRRCQGEPIAYITGQQEFWSLPFIVNPAVLIPRPETELLVETALKLFPQPDQALSLIDLGTGSGCIALALASERPHWDIIACDQSKAALTVAQKNAHNLKINHVKFVHSCWFDRIPDKKFELIISNPPYVAAADPHLKQGDLRSEPRHALSSGKDGLDAIRLIFAQSTRRLQRGGWLLLEMGYDQAEKIGALATEANYHNIQFQNDLANIKRVCMAQRL